MWAIGGRDCAHGAQPGSAQSIYTGPPFYVPTSPRRAGKALNDISEYPTFLESLLDCWRVLYQSIVLCRPLFFVGDTHVGNNNVTWRGVTGRNCLLDLNPSGVLLLDFCANHRWLMLITRFWSIKVNWYTYVPFWYISVQAFGHTWS